MTYSNIYSSPGKFGLEVICSIAWERGYNYDYTVIWKSVYGDVFLAASAHGCSCTSPFDDYGHQELEVLTSIEQILRPVKLKRAMAEFQPGGYRDYMADDLDAQIAGMVETLWKAGLR